MVNIGTANSNITELYKYYHTVAYVFLVILTMNTIKQVIFRRVHKIAKSDLVSSRLFVRMELSSHRTDFHDISFLSIFRISFIKIQVSLKSDKNNG